MTDPALDFFRHDSSKSNNLAYSRLVLRRADYHRAEGDDSHANAELAELAAQLQQRGANEAVIRKYLQMSGGTESPPPARAAAGGRARTPSGRGRRRRRS